MLLLITCHNPSTGAKHVGMTCRFLPSDQAHTLTLTGSGAECSWRSCTTNIATQPLQLQRCWSLCMLVQTTRKSGSSSATPSAADPHVRACAYRFHFTAKLACCGNPHNQAHFNPAITIRLQPAGRKSKSSWSLKSNQSISC